jgi:hypothetical protein
MLHSAMLCYAYNIMDTHNLITVQAAQDPTCQQSQMGHGQTGLWKLHFYLDGVLGGSAPTVLTSTSHQPVKPEAHGPLLA